MEEEGPHPLEEEAFKINEALRVRKRSIIPRRNGVRGGHGKNVESQPNGRPPNMAVSEKTLARRRTTI